MSDVAGAARPGWEISTRTDGDVLAARARGEEIELMLLSRTAGYDPRQIESWLAELIGVAIETSRNDPGDRPISPLLRHGLSGLLFSHAELWHHTPQDPPCSIAFITTHGRVSFGWAGPVEVEVWVDGHPAEGPWIRVRDPDGRAAQALEVESWHRVKLRLVWTAAGGPSLEIQEIDYAEVLRERHGGEAGMLDAIISTYLKGVADLDLDEPALQALSAIAGEGEALGRLVDRLVQRTTGEGPRVQAEMFLRIARSLVQSTTRARPEHVEATLRHLASAAGRLSADAMASLLALRDTPGAIASEMNVIGAMVERMTDQTIAGFVASSVITEHGANTRLATAFQSLVPDQDRRRQLLPLAEGQVAGAGLWPEPEFEASWQKVERTLLAYSDASYVSDAYARELTAATTQAVEVEQTGDDPPERIAAWLATVHDSALRALDVQLLLDLLAVETDPIRWRDLTETVALQVEGLARVGHFEPVVKLVAALVQEAGDAGTMAKRPYAAAAIERLAGGPMLRNVIGQVRTASDEDFTRFADICHAFGPIVVGPLAEALSTEQDSRVRRRLRDILVGFGARGREAVQQLMNAANWEVRRTAAFLLREFGGSGALSELEPLLHDREPLVQREAIHALVLIGDDSAYAVLARAIATTSGRARSSIVQELTGMRDERSAPLFVYLAKHLDHRGARRAVYLSVIEALGGVGGHEAVTALKDALYRGDWWAPFRTRALRGAAAAALQRIKTPEAVAVLRDASGRGPRGVRAAARAHLALEAGSR